MHFTNVHHVFLKCSTCIKNNTSTKEYTTCIEKSKDVFKKEHYIKLQIKTVKNL